jgi:hypothetical protein
VASPPDARAPCRPSAPSSPGVGGSGRAPGSGANPSLLCPAYEAGVAGKPPFGRLNHPLRARPVPAPARFPQCVLPCVSAAAGGDGRAASWQRGRGLARPHRRQALPASPLPLSFYSVPQCTVPLSPPQLICEPVSQRVTFCGVSGPQRRGVQPARGRTFDTGFFCGGGGVSAATWAGAGGGASPGFAARRAALPAPASRGAPPSCVPCLTVRVARTAPLSPCPRGFLVTTTPIAGGSAPGAATPGALAGLSRLLMGGSPTSLPSPAATHSAQPQCARCQQSLPRAPPRAFPPPTRVPHPRDRAGGGRAQGWRLGGGWRRRNTHTPGTPNVFAGSPLFLSLTSTRTPRRRGRASVHVFVFRFSTSRVPFILTVSRVCCGRRHATPDVPARSEAASELAPAPALHLAGVGWALRTHLSSLTCDAVRLVLVVPGGGGGLLVWMRGAAAGLVSLASQRPRFPPSPPLAPAFSPEASGAGGAAQHHVLGGGTPTARAFAGGAAGARPLVRARFRPFPPLTGIFFVDLVHALTPLGDGAPGLDAS